MISHYFTVALRNLRISFFHTAISVLGLALGLGAFIILINYVEFEKGYDQFHVDKDRIYRVESNFAVGNTITDDWASSSFGYAGAMKREMAEVKEVVRVNFYDSERVVKYQEKIYREKNVVFVDSNFFSFFSYKLLRGDPQKVLTEPNTMVISASAAKKYFGDTDPIGKVLEIRTMKAEYTCGITGVFEDFSPQSNLQLDLLLSYMSTPPNERDFWYMHEAYTFVKVASEVDARAIERKFPQLAEKYKTEPALKDRVWGVKLVPLVDIHLNTAKNYEFEQKGSRRTVNFMLIIALVILVVAWINYINLMISKAMERAGEVGVRKMAGASSGHLLQQFLVESLLVNVLALLLFGAFVGIFILTPGDFQSDQLFYHLWKKPLLWDILLLAFVFGVCITGSIPALILKNVNTALVLKNKLAFRSGMGKGLRQGLIIFQYFASIVLIVATITIRKQLQFMQTVDLGIDIEQTLVFKTPPQADHYDQKMATLVESLKSLGGVKAVTMSSAVAGKMVGYGMANRRAGDAENVNRMCEMLRVDYDFLPAYQLKLAKGRNFSREYPTDKETAVILTETALRLFGFKDEEEAINGFIHLEGFGDKRFNVIGVVKDFHQLSLKENFHPIVLIVFSPWNWINFHYVSLKITSSSAGVITKQAEQHFKAIFPESSFDSFFLNDYFNHQYQQDIKYSQTIMLFAWLALIIVCLGILGLSSFMLLKRTKEIGIRKVHGAETMHILTLLNRDFARWVLISFVVGTPVAWYGMTLWLQNFASRTSLDWWIFALAGLITLLITLLTVSLQSYRAAAQKPVTSLRYE